jgi:hypothetical protein
MDSESFASCAAFTSLRWPMHSRLFVLIPAGHDMSKFGAAASGQRPIGVNLILHERNKADYMAG